MRRFAHALEGHLPTSDLTEAPKLGWPVDDLEQVSACPVCGTTGRSLWHDQLWDSTTLTAPGRWSLWKCAGCHCAYLDPRPTIGSIGRAYANYYTHDDQAEQEADGSAGALARLNRTFANGYRNWRYGTKSQPSSRWGALVGALIPPLRTASDYSFRYLPLLSNAVPKVLDVGCGGGQWLMRAAQTRWRVCGTDPDPKAVKIAHSHALDVRQGGIEAWRDAPGAFDAVTLSNVIEHVHDPRQLLVASRELLRPGGMLFIETPNVEALGHSFFGRSWRGLEPPRHLVLFNRNSLLRILRELGFERIRQPFAPLLFDGIWAESRHLRELEPELPAVHPTRLHERVKRAQSAIRKRRREFLLITCTKGSERAPATGGLS